MSTHFPHYARNVHDDMHFKLLREEVNQAIKSLPGSKLNATLFKAILLPLVYVSIYSAALMQSNYLLFCLAYILMGLMIVVMFLNLIHEACHNTLFKSKWKNQCYRLLFDVMGANSFMWNKRHLRLHHNFTNVYGWDSDIEKSKFLKVHPKDEKKIVTPFHHLMVLLYPTFVLNWFLIRDFKDFFSSKTIVRKITIVPLIEYVKLFLFKIIFIGYLFLVPILVTGFSWLEVLLALIIMLLSAGMLALTVLLPPHVNTSNQFPVTDDKMNLKHSWLMHQLNTTNDVSTSNWCTRNIMANCNFHIAHHLFPNLSYVYAKEVTDVIKNYNERVGLPYRSYPIMYTFKSHYKLIRTNGRYLDLLEDDM